jgi:hypothetical protein
VPDLVGTEDTRLIVVRGNSASGKSSVAAGLPERSSTATLAIIGQDNVRRIALHERDRPCGDRSDCQLGCAQAGQGVIRWCTIMRARCSVRGG